VQLFIQSEAAHDTLQALGNLNNGEGAIQFKDLNSDKSAFQRLFVSDVRRCDDMLRIMRFLKDMMAKEKGIRKIDAGSRLPTLHELHDRLIELEKELKQHSSAFTQLQKQDNELREHSIVLEKGEDWFSSAYSRGVAFTAPSTREDGTVEMTAMEDGMMGTRSQSMLGHIAGCIPSENVHDLSLTLFRATRGNMLLRHEDINDPFPDPNTGEDVHKSVFVIFFSGERSRIKIEKICDSYGATKYKLPEERSQRDTLKNEVRDKKKDMETVLNKTREFRIRKLGDVKGNIEEWFDFVMKEKAIFYTLNMFNYDVTHKCLIAEGWCPTEDMDNIREALRKGTTMSQASVQTVINVVKSKETPPTFFRNAVFSKGTQSIVDAYGMARYQEFNPATFSFITFPFLFGVMFGDIGHGFIMALSGLLLILYEKKLAYLAKDEMFGTVYKGRYNIFLMGIFATYSGFIYNELFAVPLEIWGSTAWCSGEMADDKACASIPGTDAAKQTQKWLRTNINEAYSHGVSTGAEVSWEPYPFGTDPGWAHTSNKLNAANSFKMKFAIIAGVIQMVAGVCTKLMNTLYFQDWVTLYWVYIPEMVFINAIFGYLCILIFTKWTTNWDATFVVNNEFVVSVPQRYCMQDLSNTPCWTPPFNPSRSAIPGLSKLPSHMWCMKSDAPTAGCAVFKWKDRLIVESNVFGNNTLIDPSIFNSKNCESSAAGCVMWKQSPPSLLDSLIKMFMDIGNVPVENQIIPGQGGLQVFLILCAVIAVPCLLLPKPYILKWEHEKQAHMGHRLEDEHDAELGPAGGHGGHGHGHGEEFDFGEEMVHQMIHTIEYVLGCISNTASYLRLWALSLAHAQLSEVFWEKTVVEIGLESADTFMLFICIGAWACFTVGVLMGMESLSAFLHALRLHWVEFMNKFYFGDGYKFVPFAFNDIAAVLGETVE